MSEDSISRQDFQAGMLILRSNQIRSVGEMRSFYRTVQMEDLWHEEAKRNTPLSKSGKPMISRRAIESAAQAAKEPDRRAWATVNKSDRGGRKKGGGGRGKKRSKSSSDGDQITANGHGNFVLIWPVSFVQPWLPLCRELCASFSINTQSFPFAVQLWPLF